MHEFKSKLRELFKQSCYFVLVFTKIFLYFYSHFRFLLFFLSCHISVSFEFSLNQHNFHSITETSCLAFCALSLLHIAIFYSATMIFSNVKEHAIEWENQQYLSIKLIERFKAKLWQTVGNHHLCSLYIESKCCICICIEGEKGWRLGEREKIENCHEWHIHCATHYMTGYNLFLEHYQS